MNNTNHNTFINNLIEAEQVTPDLQSRYTKKVHDMLEQKLTRGKRWAYAGTMVMGIGFTILFGAIAILVPKEFPVLGRIGFGIGALFGLAWALFAFQILRKGTVNLRKDETTSAGMSWGFTVIMITLFMLMSSQLPGNRGVLMMVKGLIFLVTAAVFLIKNEVKQAELRMREKMLEIECMLIELKK